MLRGFLLELIQHMNYHITGKTSRTNADETGQKEAVVNDKFTDMRSTRTVKADAGEV